MIDIFHWLFDSTAYCGKRYERFCKGWVPGIPPFPMLLRIFVVHDLGPLLRRSNENGVAYLWEGIKERGKRVRRACQRTRDNLRWTLFGKRIY